MTTSSVKISVLLPVVDEWALLRQALHSIFSQDFENYEVVIRVDGGAIPETCQEFNNSKITWMSGERVGLAQSLNLMAVQAQGPLLMRLDADDEMLPGRMRSQYQKWLEAPRALICGHTKIEAEKDITFVKGETHLGYATFRLLTINPLVHSSVALDKKTFEKLGGYDSSWAVAQDYELWCRWFEKYPVVLHEEVVSIHRHVFNKDKLKKQQKNISQLVKQNVSRYVGDVSESEAEELSCFAGGLGGFQEYRQFQKNSQRYQNLMLAFVKERKDAKTVKQLFDDYWPYLLGRNLMESSAMSLLTKLICILKNPSVLRAYTLKRLLFARQ